MFPTKWHLFDFYSGAHALRIEHVPATVLRPCQCDLFYICRVIFLLLYIKITKYFRSHGFSTIFCIAPLDLGSGIFSVSPRARSDGWFTVLRVYTTKTEPRSACGNHQCTRRILETRKGRQKSRITRWMLNLLSTVRCKSDKDALLYARTHTHTRTSFYVLI